MGMKLNKTRPVLDRFHDSSKSNLCTFQLISSKKAEKMWWKYDKVCQKLNKYLRHTEQREGGREHGGACFLVHFLGLLFGALLGPSFWPFFWPAFLAHLFWACFFGRFLGLLFRAFFWCAVKKSVAIF